MASRSVILSSVCALCLSSVASAVSYGHNTVRVNRDSDAVAQNFLPTNLTLYGPASEGNVTFLPGFKAGTQPPVDQQTLEDYVKRIASKNPSWATYHAADFVSEEGRSFPYVYLSASGAGGNFSSLHRAKRTESQKVKVWVQGGVHGNEPAGDMATLALLGKLDAEPEWRKSLLDKLDVLVLPRYNPDGEYYFQRTLPTNYDPNRDHIKLNRQQTADIKKLFNKFEPHVALDMHEYGAASRYGTGLLQAADALLSAAKNLNINPSIRKLSESLFATGIGERLEAGGFRWEPYVTNGTTPAWPIIRFDEAGTDGKIGRNAMGLSQTVTFLFETRGIGLADQEFRRRTQCALTMITSALEIASANAHDVYKTIEGGREEFINSNTSIVITDRNVLENATYQMIWAANGSLVDVSVQFMSATNARANLTRTRPSAYLIPRSWADVAAKLTTLGLEVEELDSEFVGTVEARNITSSKVASSFYEGTFLNTVTTSEGFEREIVLPAGSFKVDVKQKNAALAFVALEPENIDSFVSFNIIPLDVGDEYPVFRLP